MALLTKTLVSWNQPRRFRDQMRTVGKRVTNWWVKPVLVLGLAGLFLLQWYLATLKEGPKNPPPFDSVLWVVLGGSCVIIYGIPWLVWLLPSPVSVNERGFTQEKLFMPFENLAAHAWFPADEFSTLLLVDKAGGRKLFGVPKGETEAKLKAVLRERNVPEDSTLKPFVETQLQPTVLGGMAILAPAFSVILLFGLLGGHAVLVTHLTRESKNTREQASRDWLEVRTELIKEGIPPEKLPASPFENYRSTPKALAIQRYLVLAPVVCLIAIVFLAVSVLKYRMQMKNLQRLLEEKAKLTGAGAPISPSASAAD